MEYVSSKIACQKLGICRKTLQNYANNELIDYIRTPGGWRKYDISAILPTTSLVYKKICYCRVSGYEQKSDLNRQISKLQKLYPTHEIISDIGSGINFKRKCLRKIIEYAISGTLSNLVLLYKDRLCRIGYDLLEYIFEKYSKTKITIINTDIDADKITKDLIEIITVYGSKIHSMRAKK